jgi:hypothetical protein
MVPSFKEEITDFLSKFTASYTCSKPTYNISSDENTQQAIKYNADILSNPYKLQDLKTAIDKYRWVYIPLQTQVIQPTTPTQSTPSNPPKNIPIENILLYIFVALIIIALVVAAIEENDKSSTVTGTEEIAETPTYEEYDKEDKLVNTESSQGGKIESNNQNKEKNNKSNSNNKTSKRQNNNSTDKNKTPDIKAYYSSKGLTFVIDNVYFTMVKVQGGSFIMGATYEQGTDYQKDETPTHQVTLSSYYIGETEVTQELWKVVMGENPSHSKGDNLPVENVSWNDCQKFINRLNELTGFSFYLPTEAQWEFAARGGNESLEYKYSGSNYISGIA